MTMSATPEKKTLRKAFKEGLVLRRMLSALDDDIQIDPKWYLMDAWSGLYRVLYPDDAKQSRYYPCRLAGYIEKMCADGIISREDVIVTSFDKDCPVNDKAEIRLENGVWRLQTDLAYPFRKKDLKLIACHRDCGDQAQGRIDIGPHFIEFLHEMGSWNDMLVGMLERYCHTACQMKAVDNIARTTLLPVLDSVFKGSGYEYTVDYHSTNFVEIRIKLHSGNNMRVRLTLEELQAKADTMLEELKTLDAILKGYGANVTITHPSKKK